jgi:hypothetical protein
LPRRHEGNIAADDRAGALQQLRRVDRHNHALEVMYLSLESNRKRDRSDGQSRVYTLAI